MATKKVNNRINHDGDEYFNRNCGGRGIGYRRREKDNVTGMQHAQEGEVVSGSDGRTKARITCFRCEKKGHFADFFLDIETGEEQVEEGDSITWRH